MPELDAMPRLHWCECVLEGKGGGRDSGPSGTAAVVARRWKRV
jgi:hypothetical protein